ncbi:ParB-like nuclease domain-containing protein [Pseudosulfitobacter pseudonitzschiae]|uniref:ParB-like N-terminal domain-containing protein n=1 Tax=Pseudosulfitobacter pseudonitzschiae TaxID=1402135 RepID=A0A073J620_9RHOB|nr:ParB N-terminal domain-containing protein [Pseudosulfitobacter pseudonitzschiae]KEJ97414.1 hypothetical protein SUH3_00070 [Pseudosulfitobacter pseudonitzschiae]QKS08705.1 ParB N-terminal domain-containing protein [Pseudosulfitobacter pseudonitzschiae]SHE71792.1 ParB-like nuclease domain-containing protein [Pseudosulfitobacter pseudonitzschiae]
MSDADFRPIVLPDDFRPTPKPPPELALEWIPVRALVIDTGYQRPLARENWNKINAISVAFDWRFFTPVLVSPLGDGRYALIDGQHRSHAALRAGYDAVPALVVPMSRAHQASSFMAVNGAVTKVSMFHLYRAGLMAGDAWAIQVREVVEAAGCRVMLSNHSAAEKKAGEVYSISMVRGFCRAGKGWAVTRALAALMASTHGAAADAFKEAFMSPLIHALANCPMGESLLVAFLNAQDFKLLHRKVDRLREEPRYKNVTRITMMRDVLLILMQDWNRRGGVAA